MPQIEEVERFFVTQNYQTLGYVQLSRASEGSLTSSHASFGHRPALHDYLKSNHLPGLIHDGISVLIKLMEHSAASIEQEETNRHQAWSIQFERDRQRLSSRDRQVVQ